MTFCRFVGVVISCLKSGCCPWLSIRACLAAKNCGSRWVYVWQSGVPTHSCNVATARQAGGPGIEWLWSHFCKSIPALPRPSSAIVETGRVLEHLCLEELLCKWREHGFWLMHAICCARITGLSEVHVSWVSMGVVNCHLAGICLSETLPGC